MPAVTFYCHGHENILATHRSTYEFTKEENLTLNGDCIVGVSSTFQLQKIKPLLKAKRAEISVFHKKSMIFQDIFRINDMFHDADEIVIRKSEFLSKRTLGSGARKGACDFDRGVIYKMKDPKEKLKVIIKPLK